MTFSFRFWFLPLVAPVFFCGQAVAQSADEYPVWRKHHTFEPYSRTAEAITGAISLKGDPDGHSGSEVTMTFGNGKKARLVSTGLAQKQWDDTSDQIVTGEVFTVTHDPGVLKNHNSLCGGSPINPARYIVLMESTSVTGSALLGMAVFQSQTLPQDINSDGLCGTFNYSVPE